MIVRTDVDMSKRLNYSDLERVEEDLELVRGEPDKFISKRLSYIDDSIEMLEEDIEEAESEKKTHQDMVDYLQNNAEEYRDRRVSSIDKRFEDIEMRESEIEGNVSMPKYLEMLKDELQNDLEAHIYNKVANRQDGIGRAENRKKDDEDRIEEHQAEKEYVESDVDGYLEEIEQVLLDEKDSLEEEI